jgi:hypothetical protein
MLLIEPGGHFNISAQVTLRGALSSRGSVGFVGEEGAVGGCGGCSCAMSKVYS